MLYEKTLIVEDDERFLSTCEKLLDESNVRMLRCEKNSAQIISTIIEEKPKLVVMDSFLADIDALGIMRYIDAIGISEKPLFMITMTFESARLVQELKKAGATYLLCKPVDSFVLCKRIDELLHADVNEHAPAWLNRANAKLEVNELLRKLGISVGISGYQYIREAVLISLDNNMMPGAVTKLLYPSVAEKFGVTSACVERSIRYAIETAWNRRNAQVISECIGYCANNHSKPSNSAFIAALAENVRMKYKT